MKKWKEGGWKRMRRVEWAEENRVRGVGVEGVEEGEGEGKKEEIGG